MDKEAVQEVPRNISAESCDEVSREILSLVAVA